MYSKRATTDQWQFLCGKVAVMFLNEITGRINMIWNYSIVGLFPSCSVTQK